MIPHAVGQAKAPGERFGGIERESGRWQNESVGRCRRSNAESCPSSICFWLLRSDPCPAGILTFFLRRRGGPCATPGGFQRLWRGMRVSTRTLGVFEIITRRVARAFSLRVSMRSSAVSVVAAPASWSLAAHLRSV